MRLIAFDLDGTLVDSRTAILGCFRHAQEARGLEPVLDAEIAARIGLPLSQMLAGLVAEDAVESVLDVYRRDFADFDRRHTLPFSGIPELLEALAATDAVLAVTSSKTRHGVVRVVEEQGLAHHFGFLMGGDDVQQGKPHPEMLERAMARAGSAPETTTIVGDTTYDVEMGLAAGARAVGVGWGMHGAARLAGIGAHAVVERVEDLAAAIDGGRKFGIP